MNSRAFYLTVLLSEISLSWGTSTIITFSGIQKVFWTLVGRKFFNGSSLLTSFLSMILTPLLFIVLLAIDPLLIFFFFSYPFCSWKLPVTVSGKCIFHAFRLCAVASITFISVRKKLFGKFVADTNTFFI